MRGRAPSHRCHRRGPLNQRGSRIRGSYGRPPMTGRTQAAGWKVSWQGFVVRPVHGADLPQPYRHVVVLQLEIDGCRHEIAIDYADDSRLNEECRRRCGLYFKMQFLSGGYGDDSVVPGGFPPSWPSLYNYLGRLREIRGQRRFASDVYGRFNAEPAPQTRREAVRLLREQQRFTYEGGLRVLRYSRYLTEIARSKVCVDLPGYGDFCFRLIDYLAIGSCVIGRRPSTSLHAPLTHGINIVYCADDLSDLVELCDYYSNQTDEREHIAEEARAHFDRYLERTQWAAYSCTQRFGTSADALAEGPTRTALCVVSSAPNLSSNIGWTS